VIQWSVDSYRGIKLLEHAMKVVERIFEHRIRQQIEVYDMQLPFYCKTDAGEFRVKENKLYFGFDRVPREVI